MREPKFIAKIAKQLRKFHEVDIPGSREPQLWIDISKFFVKASQLLVAASNLRFDDIEKQRKYETISFEEVQSEVIEPKALTEGLNALVVFSHNDLLSRNIMVNKEEGETTTMQFNKYCTDSSNNYAFCL